jgi:predicted RND superfamily exporter protein
VNQPARKISKAKAAKRSRPRPWFARWSLLILATFALVSPILAFGAVQAVRSNTNQVADWLPESFSETGELAWYRKHFVSDQFVVLSWEGCEVDADAEDAQSLNPDPRIHQLASLLTSDQPIAGRSGALPYGHYFKSVLTGPRMLEYLVESDSSVPFPVAKERLVGTLLGPDRKQTCLVVTLSDESLSQFRTVLSRPFVGPLGYHHPPGVLFEAIRECGIEADSVRLGGPPVDNTAIDQEGERTLVRLAGLSALLGVGLSWWSLRSIRLTLIVFACGLLSATMALASLWGTGAKTDAIVLSMPALVYVLAISGAIHLINYYHHALLTGGSAAAPGMAIAMGSKPALLCSVTTALGLLSLCTSDLVPIRKFGLYSAIGVMQILVVLFLFLPAALFWWPSKSPAAKGSKTTRVAFEPPLPSRLDRFWDHLGRWIIRHHAFVSIGFLLMLIGFASGLQHYRTSIDLMKLFDPQARIITDYRWLEGHVGRLVPVEVVLRFAPDAIAAMDDAATDPSDGARRWSLVERMNMVAEVQRGMEREFGERGSGVIGPTMSALTFVAPLPNQDRSLGSFVHRKVMNRKLENSYDALVGSGYLAIDQSDQSELWRISLRVAAFQDVDYGVFTDTLKRVVDPVVERLTNSRRAGVTWTSVAKQDEAPDLSAVYTGVVPIVYKAQTALLSSMISSTLWSFLTITPLLMFVSRGVLAGMVAMIPNVLPVLVVFGGLSWLGRPIDIGSMMAASIALGVAVDDTIHYLTWYREALNREGDRYQAILSAYQHCATPTMQATVINGLGLSVFVFSSFSPTKQFGFLMLIILFAGAIAELLLLPAILAGPLGKAFKPRVADHSGQPAAAAPATPPPARAVELSHAGHHANGVASQRRGRAAATGASAIANSAE